MIFAGRWEGSGGGGVEIEGGTMPVELEMEGEI